MQLSYWNYHKTICFLTVGPSLDVKFASTFREEISQLAGVHFFPEVDLSRAHALIKASFAIVNSSIR